MLAGSCRQDSSYWIRPTAGPPPGHVRCSRSAQLQRPPKVISDRTKEEKLAYVNTVVKLLDMEEYSNTILDVPGEGLNVEQGKGVSIGVEGGCRKAAFQRSRFKPEPIIRRCRVHAAQQPPWQLQDDLQPDNPIDLQRYAVLHRGRVRCGRGGKGQFQSEQYQTSH